MRSVRSGWSLLVVGMLASSARAEEPVVAGAPRALVTTLDAPACFEERRVQGVYYEPTTLHVLLQQRGTEASLVTVYANTDRVARRLWAGPVSTPREAILAAVPEEEWRALAASHPDAQRCEVQTVDHAVDIGGQLYRVTRVAGRNALVGEHYMTLLAMGDDTPRWWVRSASGVSVVTEGPGGWTSELIWGGMRSPTWYAAPEAHDVARRAPKPIAGATPDILPHDRRCRAWSRATRSALVVRVEEACGGKGGHCSVSKTLVEIGPKGVSSRVNLAQGGTDWPNMFARANRIIERADLGCLVQGDAAGPQPEWTVRFRRDDVLIVGPTAETHATTLGEGGVRESLLGVFWHPDIAAAVIEVQRSAGDRRTSRFVWVDLAKLGVAARPSPTE